MAYEAEEVWDDLVAILQDRAEDYQTYHDYWMAEQDLPISTTEFQTRFGTTFSQFRDNMARPVIEAAESRVRITEFPSDAASELWSRMDMESKSRLVHTEAMVKGDAYVIVLPDEDKNTRIWPQVSDSCAITYEVNDPDVKRAAIKVWVEDMENEGLTRPVPYVRVNLYFEDRIERYVSKSESERFITDISKYERYTEEGDAVTTHKAGEVPMFEFNTSYDLQSGKGRSDLADATGFIDAINKTFLDLLTASEFTAAPQRWATGVEIPLDPQTGEPTESFKAGDHKLWTAPSETAKFGQFSPGDLKAYRDAVDLLVDHLGYTTRTPSYALTTQVQYPSGPALRSAEAPLRSRVSDHQTAYSPPWRKAMQVAMKLDGTEVDDQYAAELVPRWLPPNAPFSTQELLEELKVLVEVLGVPEEMAWRRAGFTSAEIVEMLEMREAEAVLGEDAFAAATAAAVLSPQEVPGGLAQDNLIEPTPEEVPVGEVV